MKTMNKITTGHNLRQGYSDETGRNQDERDTLRDGMVFRH